MKNSSRLSFRSFPALFLSGAVLLPAAFALGDTIWFESGRAKAIVPLENITVSDIRREGGTEVLTYTANASGRPSSKALETVSRIQVEGETAFNQAELDFSTGKFKEAGDGYRIALKHATAEWLKHRIGIRQGLVATKTGDFVAAVSSFVDTAKNDPNAAVKLSPPIDAKVTKDQMTQAIALVTGASAKASPDTKQALYPFLISLYNATGNSPLALATTKELQQIQANNHSVAGSLDSADNGAARAAATAAEADTYLKVANTAFAGQKYAEVVTTITTHSASFIDADHQARALFLLAEAKAAQANSDETWKDAALAYMRVVAHCKTAKDIAAEALYKTGVIEEKLKQPADAVLIYNQVISEFAGSPAVKDATTAVSRLKAAQG